MRPSRIKPGMRLGCLEVTERAPDCRNANTQWLCRCQCGKRVVLGYSTVVNWVVGRRSPPTNCHEAHVMTDSGHLRGKVRTQWRGPCSAMEMARRQRMIDDRDTPRQNVSCEECAGQPWRRALGKRCACGGWHAEDKTAEQKPLLGSSMGSALC